MSEILTNWQQVILSYFVPKQEQMLLVIDPDNLMRDDVLLAEIQKRNYDVLEFIDEVSFRNHFERTYRSKWDNGESKHVVVVVHTHDSQRHIPYDIWRKSKHVELSVSRLFPNLNAIVVSQLDNAWYADLYPAHQQLLGRNDMRRLERETVEFILRVVFDIDPLGKQISARWVEFLIHKHYSLRALPPALQTYMIANLLPQIAPTGLTAAHFDDASLFYAWLQTQWQRYVEQALNLAQPTAINLGDPRLRSLLGYLFTDGHLHRIAAKAEVVPSDATWIHVGLYGNPDSAYSGSPNAHDQRAGAIGYALLGRLERFTDSNALITVGTKTDLRDWLNLAAEWAEAIYQANSLPKDAYVKVQPALFEARQSLDTIFTSFIQERYGAVAYYQDNKGPLNVSGVNMWLHSRFSNKDRVALICFDGLALDQWYLLKAFLSRMLHDLSFVEKRTYAIAPTLTSISRQSLFAGRPPVVFEPTILQTNKDASHWQAFWVNHNIPPRRIAHIKMKIGAGVGDELRACVDGKNQRLGILINLFDDVMHQVKGMSPDMDKRIYYGALNAHLENSQLHMIFSHLLEGGYHVFVTADHGNIAGVGNGIRPPKALVESYARRVALFDHLKLAEDFAQQHDAIHMWTKMLPTSIQPVYLRGTQLFGSKDQTHISHGGISIEELIVPLVEVQAI